MALRGLSTVAVAVAVTASVYPPGSRCRVDKGTPRLCCGARFPSSGRRISVACKAVGEKQQGPVDETILYDGIYGPWTIDDSDVREVILYRSGLVTTATSFVVAAAAAAFLPDNTSLSTTLKQNLDLFYVLGSGGLGLSLFLIHIYVSEIKRALQALWVLGVLGSATTYFTLAQPANKNLIQYVVDNPSAIWFVGPLFAALTGLVFKEGLCYGKLEAGLLTFVIPTVLLGHLTGLMDDGVKLTLLASWMTLFVIFAARKFTQPIKDDIGDKSVFMFNSLPDDERKTLLEKLEQQNS
ncbi:hypothetical protein PHAVU_007G000300 [Phaseolus vulgaris]|uniref:Integral membrane protein n=1 Tax=Phaseolus vulgaris TaxID=3885 RepID=V7B9N0_PHAVU|nr:hypothetical protein PHAVU_007G000300g [Phaseolus vulgaris]ESW14582.1 hypothetical protein PHAVU_007G000300g [Phaseolus vulgaris]